MYKSSLKFVDSIILRSDRGRVTSYENVKMPAKKKRPVKVGRPVAKRSSQEASVAEEAAEQDQQEETRSRSRSPSPSQAQASVPPTATAAKKKKKSLAKGESYAVHEDHEGIQRHGKEDTPLEFQRQQSLMWSPGLCSRPGTRASGQRSGSCRTRSAARQQKT